MSSKPTIANAGNVVVPAYLALRGKGYSVHRERHSDGREETWLAENGSIRVIAEDPVALLGLVAMAESRGNDWKASDQQIETFLKEFEA